jgi:DAK2 domain fusion protein YloV
MAAGSLMGAQGNSGIILSQVLRAFSDTIEGVAAVTAPLFTASLQHAADTAYRAVGRPVEGTMLTVLKDAAAAAGASDGDLAVMADEVYRSAEASLRATPDLLPVLAEAGVVDAGGAGLLLLLAAVTEVVTGRTADLPEDVFGARTSMSVGSGDPEGAADDLRYEVMFLLDGDSGAGQRLKEAWAELGDSIVVVGGGGTWNCHIHTNGIGPAIEAGIDAGRPHRIVVTDLAEQSAGHDGLKAFEPLPEARNAKVGLVAVASGPGLVELFRQWGAQAVVAGGQTMNPSVGDLLDAVERVPARAVVILPNNENVVPAAEQLDRLTKKSVWVVPTTSIPAGIAAAVAYVPGREAEDFVPAMGSAASQVTSGELARAVRDARTPTGVIEAGDWLGMVDGVVRAITPVGLAGLPRLLERILPAGLRSRRDRDRATVVLRRALIDLLRRTVGADAEIVTIICGSEADVEVTEAAVGWLTAHRADAEVSVIEGGQPLYPYLVGAE